MSYTERDSEIMKDIHDGERQKARNTIAEFLAKDQSGITKLEDAMTQLIGSLGKAGKTEIYNVLQAIVFLGDELIACLRKEQE
jgi:hypothetical protein